MYDASCSATRLMDFKMKFFFFLAAVFVSKILTSRVIALDENSLSRLLLTRYHRRLKGFGFDTFHSASLLSCALQCRRLNPRCVSTKFRKAPTFEETDGICELNDRGVLLPQHIKGRELVHDEETVYSQFYDRKVRQMCYYDMKTKQYFVRTNIG